MNPKTFAYLVAALAAPVTLLGANSSTIRSPLTNTSVDSDAAGSILSVLQSKQSVLTIEMSKLAEKQPYSLKVGEVTEAQFTTDDKGRARLRFATKAEKNKAVLDFDPRGKTIAVLDSEGKAVLQAVVSGEGEPEGIVVDERSELASEDGVKGKGTARYVSQKNGRRSFEVKLSGTTAAGLHLFVDGIDRGEIEVHGRSGRIAFSSSPRGNQSSLDFDPRSAKIDIIGSDDLLKFSGKLEAKAKGVNFAVRNTQRVLIPSTGADPDGQAEAKLRINADASKDFSVELEDVPAGSYNLLVNDVVRGTVVVAARPDGGTKGEIEFTSQTDDNGELPLTFDPVGTTLTIRQDTTVFFTGTFQPDSNTGVPAPGESSLISERLASTGLDADASGEAEFSSSTNGETEFEVEIESVNAGSYQLFVDGTLRGTIEAIAATDGRVKGKIKFETEGAGEDRVRTALRGGRDDGGGDDRGGSGGGGSDDPAGDDKGGTSGGGGTDDPAGDDHGGGGGDESNVPKLPLRFDPRGKLIEIKGAGGVYFSHLFGDGSAPAPGDDGPGAAVPGEISIALISSGADADGTAAAEFKRDENGGESFEVELEDLPAGSYELLVGGTLRGSVNVVVTDRGTRGKIEFDDEPAASELPLDFDPLGQVLTVQKDGTVYFQRTFPSGS
ncbi:hypothetical protein ACXR0O_11615 [Verrucomicrobiota bacterium sgz303538]